MPSSNIYQILTTCKPSHSTKEFLAANELVLCCTKNKWPCILINRAKELPKDFSLNESIGLAEPISTGIRPTLHDFSSATNAEWLVIANSDIWLDAHLELTLSFLDSHDIDFASTQRWDLPENVRISDYLRTHEIPINAFKQIAKHQSMRTMDLFVVRNRALGIAMALNDEIGKLIPGTVGFDNNLLGLMTEITKTADLSSTFNVFHTNHESFRKVFRKNYVTNRGQQASFIEKRGQQRVLHTRKGCLSWTDFKIEYQNGEMVHIQNKFRNFSYYVESIRIKLSNGVENKLFNFNTRIYEIIKRLNVFSPAVRTVFGNIIVYPVFSDKSNNITDKNYGEIVSELIDERVRKWKTEFNKTIGFIE